MSAPHLPPVGTVTTSDDCTPSQETAVSALTTNSSFVNLLMDSGGEEDTQLLPLTSIFHCPFIKESANTQIGKVSWLCKWCGKTFFPRHQSRALKHVLNIKLGDIAVCSSLIPKEY